MPDARSSLLIAAVLFAGVWATAASLPLAYGWDAAALSAAQGIQGPVLDHVFRAVTWFGSVFFLIPACLALAMALRPRVSFWVAMLPTLSVLAAALASAVLKLVFDRPRPDFFPSLIDLPSDASYPSAHAAQVTAAALAVTLSLPRLGWGVRSMLLVLVLLTCTSRLYLQVHFLSDIVAGAMLGTSVALALGALVSLKERGP